MPAFDQGTFDDGTPYTIGTCDDDRYRGLNWISIGDSYNHTTFIVYPDETGWEAMKYRGSDKIMWEAIAVRVILGSIYELEPDDSY